MRLDTDPTWERIVIIGVLQFLITIIGGLLIILQSGDMPSEIQLYIIILTAALELVTLLSAFIKTGEIPKEVEM